LLPKKPTRQDKKKTEEVRPVKIWAFYMKTTTGPFYTDLVQI
jgi:hypothetical protein